VVNHAPCSGSSLTFVWSKLFSLFLVLNFLVFAVVGGSLFLFDRKILRYFRKDGHNWRKKKDGKTIKEAHEKLKVSKCLLFMWETTLWKVAVALLVVIVLMLLYPHY
jgi:hypothetical protein